MTDTRWLIVCDCVGHPEELVGEVLLNAAGEARVWSTGRSGGAPSLRGANRMILDTPPSRRGELLKKLRTREIYLPATVSFFHPPCGRNLRVSENHLGELLAAVSSAVRDGRVSLAVLCAVNGRLPRDATR